MELRIPQVEPQVDDGFIDLLTASQQPLFAYINTLLCGDANVRDVLQETNIELWRKAHLYDREKPFLPWAYRFAYFRAQVFRRSQGTSRLVFSDEILRAVDQAYRDTHVEASDKLLALNGCLQRLRPKHRELIRQRYEEGKSPADIARTMDVSESIVGGRLYRVRKLLFNCIEFRVREANT